MKSNQVSPKMTESWKMGLAQVHSGSVGGLNTPKEARAYAEAVGWETSDVEFIATRLCHGESKS